MAFDFDPTLATDKDWIRFKLDDVVESDLSIPDETIEALLDQSSSRVEALLACGQALYIKLLKKFEEAELASQRVKYRDRAYNLKKLLDEWATSGVPGEASSSPIQMIGGEIKEPNLDLYRRFL